MRKKNNYFTPALRELKMSKQYKGIALQKRGLKRHVLHFYFLTFMFILNFNFFYGCQNGRNFMTVTEELKALGVFIPIHRSTFHN